ncbi:EthD domain-containing protein [Frankia sp. AgB1.9]|uniref:EthD domain-containing protein n=1 Tax=unclassified Frankia TaxID=2632575 RepID=UPI00193162AF|nr:MULTISPECIES: EthD domain-containing protein [unclassified Frankia]MBL7488249.1 EthD domain-containing protein [Frankia sp. AgW1.1]MBL7548108.1 EthD domain-containing protein [Frankia sp. AgB1.9]MBL7620334.1 EthD domain-containing protein [Frankia sp. AgB1.8]
MIKLIRFGAAGPARSADAFEAAWRREARRAAEAPPDARPARVTVATVLAGLSGPAERPGSGTSHDVVSFLWFPDAECLARFEAWQAATGATAAGATATGVTAAGLVASSVVARERVARGADWLAAHAASGGGAFKHIALSRRADGLTRAEFSRLWAEHGGVVQTSGASAVIPEAARGQAYVQNHPDPTGDEPAYDAVNEVYFADLAGLRGRVSWFQQNPPTGGLFGRSEYLAVREVVVASAATVDVS